MRAGGLRYTARIRRPNTAAAADAKISVRIAPGNVSSTIDKGRRRTLREASDISVMTAT